MPRPLTLSLDGVEISVGLFKIDRTQLYGDVAVEAFDEHGHPATIKVLASDGNTLIDKGGTALEMVDRSGNSINRDKIRTVDRDGNELVKVQSSFTRVNKLVSATVDDYLSLIVKSIYWLQANEASSFAYLQDHLKNGSIFSFPFSFRDGIESDEAFLIGSGKTVFMIIGNQATLQFLSFDQAAALDTTEEDEISSDDLDFDLL